MFTITFNSKNPSESDEDVDKSVLNEEDGDDEGSDSEGSEDEGSEDEGSDSEGSDSEGSGEDGKAEPHVPFANLDLTSAICFGWCPLERGRRSWVRLADQSVTKGWKNTDVRTVGDDLMKNVDACYFFIAQGGFVDLDSNMRYQARFNNDIYLWELSIANSPDAEILPDQAADFFKSEFFKKFAMRCHELILRGANCYRKILKPHMRNGEFLQVSETKLERILFEVNVAKFMENLRDCKYRLK